MAFAPTSPVTGSAQTGLTSPTYTLTADQAPDVNGKQYAITALGGTQTGVSVHSTSIPFTLTAWRPKVPRILGVPNPVTGIIPAVPNNTYKFVVRKGVLPAAGQPARLATFTVECSVPAGSESYDLVSLRAGLSCLFGAAASVSSAWGDTLAAGTL